jgi:hypothetical protein
MWVTIFLHSREWRNIVIHGQLKENLCLFDVNLIKDDKKKKTHKNLYKQRLNVKKIQNKFLNLIKILFSWKYRFAFHSVPKCPVPSTEMSHMFSTEMSHTFVCSVPSLILNEMSSSPFHKNL